MKETQHGHDTAIEVKANKDQEKQSKFIASVILKPGQKLWCYDMETAKSADDINVVDLLDKKNYRYGEYTDKNKLRTVKELIMKDSCIYVAAINKKNAAKKILLKFGMKWNKKTKQAEFLFPVLKGEDRFIDVDVPEEMQDTTRAQMDSFKMSVVHPVGEETTDTSEVIGLTEVEDLRLEPLKDEIHPDFLAAQLAAQIKHESTLRPGKHFENDGAYADDTND